MDRNELLLAIREARKALRGGADVRLTDILAVFEGIAPFLDRNIVISIKCKGCDSYARASFPLKDDFYAVENHSYCHAKMLSLKNLSLPKIMACQDFSQESRREMAELAATLLEDLRAAFAGRSYMTRTSLQASMWRSTCRRMMRRPAWSSDTGQPAPLRAAA